MKEGVKNTKALLGRLWQASALRGIISLFFGVGTLVRWSGISYVDLIVLFGLYALMDGVISFVGSVANRKENRDWWLMALSGLSSFIIGYIVFVLPDAGATGEALWLPMGVRALLMGCLDIIIAIRLWKTIKEERFLILTGSLSVLLGAILLFFPLYLFPFYTTIFDLLKRFFIFFTIALGLLQCGFAYRVWRGRPRWQP